MNKVPEFIVQIVEFDIGAAGIVILMYGMTELRVCIGIVMSKMAKFFWPI